MTPMARAFYNYTITILNKVSFDPLLFNKELEKSYKALLPHEKRELRIWLNNFLLKKPELKKHLTKSPVLSKQEIHKAS